MDRRNHAEAVALQALGWLAAQPELMERFLIASGTDPGALRARIGDGEFLAAVLDFLLTEDAWVTGFAAEAGLAPEALLSVRAALPGGNLPNWT